MQNETFVHELLDSEVLFKAVKKVTYKLTVVF